MGLVLGSVIAAGVAGRPFLVRSRRHDSGFRRPARAPRRTPAACQPHPAIVAFLRNGTRAALASCAAVVAVVAICSAAFAWSEVRGDEAPAPASVPEAPAPAVAPASAAEAPVPAPAPAPVVAPVVEPAAPPVARPRPKTRSLGVFEVTAYCPCAKCCGKWAELPESERPPLRGPYCAADLGVLPRGTRVHVQGVGWRQVSDTGSDIVGRRLDLLMKSHWRATRFGRQWRRVEVRVETN